MNIKSKVNNIEELDNKGNDHVWKEETGNWST